MVLILMKVSPTLNSFNFNLFKTQLKLIDIQKMYFNIVFDLNQKWFNVFSLRASQAKACFPHIKWPLDMLLLH